MRVLFFKHLQSTFAVSQLLNSEILSRRGKPKFQHNGHIYVVDRYSKSNPDIIFWRCQRKMKCNGRIHTQNEEVIKVINGHTHEPSPVCVELAKIITNIIELSESSQEPAEIVEQSTQNLSKEAQELLPSQAALYKLIKRRRNKILLTNNRNDDESFFWTYSEHFCLAV